MPPLQTPPGVLSAGQLVEDPVAPEAHHVCTANGREIEKENLDAGVWEALSNLL